MEQLYKIKRYNKDSIICLENSKSSPVLYLIKEGKVRRDTKIGDVEEKEILNEGHTFGFVTCFMGVNYFERITAITDCTLVLIDKPYVIPFFMKQREVFLKLLKEYSNKLRSLDNYVDEESGTEDRGSYFLRSADYFKKQEMKDELHYSLNCYLKETGDRAGADDLAKKYGLTKLDEDNKTHYSENEVKVAKDRIIFLEKEQGDNFYFIESGRVKISHIYNDHELILAILEPGEFFGEMAILNRTFRMASAVAFEDCRLLSLDSNNLIEKLNEKILLQVFLSMVKRLYHTYRRANNLKLVSAATKLYDCLEYCIVTNHGVRRENSFHLYFSIEELKRMTGLYKVSDRVFEGLFKDGNIRKSYGEIIIIDTELFYDKFRRMILVDGEIEEG